MSKPLQRILCLEDDDDIREVVVMSLELVGGLEVLACARGEELLAKGPDFAPDLVLLDVMAPGMDGPTTLAALRALPALDKTPAVFLTAKAQPAEISRLMGLGAIGVLTKPFDPTTLPDALCALWAKRNA